MEEKIRSLIENVLNVKLTQLADLPKHAVDSLDLINILFKLESELGIKISNEDVSNNQLTDMGKLVNYLKTKVTN